FFAFQIPLNETDLQLQKFQDFKRGLLYGSLVLVYSSLESDAYRYCAITYYPNRGPTPDGRIEVLTTGLRSTRPMTQVFDPHRVMGHNATYRARARLYRKDAFHETKVIFTDYKFCTILRTRSYHNLCELFTGGRHDSDRVNSWCFFIYTVFCGQPAVSYKTLDECWRRPRPHITKNK
ncbi:unnamed protein product, partial [Ixodes hexagonus]